MATAATPDAALRPLTLPSLPPDLAHLSTLKQHLHHLRQDIHAYAQLQTKLETFTDEPTWDAYIPLGPLAYLPGKLIHTNDIAVPLPSAPATADGSLARAENGDRKGKGTGADESAAAQPERALRSAKQAREDAARLQTELEKQAKALEKEIEEKEAEMKRKREEARREGAGKGGEMEEDWTVNERGELINEEGLPMFDIHEDLPPTPEPASSPSTSSSAAPDEGKSAPKPKMRYLVKKGGKTVVRPLPTPSPAAPPPAPNPAPPPPATAIANANAVDTSTPHPPLDLTDLRALLDELEAEEEVERAKLAAAAEEAAPKPEKEETKPAPAPAAAAPSAFAGFSAGFLSKTKGTKQKRPSNSLPPPRAASTPSSSSSSSAAAAPAAPVSAPVAPAPGPPADPKPLKSALSSRASSPAPRSIFAKPPEKKKSVAWDASVVGAAEGEGKKEGKKPIILGLDGAPPGEKVEEVEELRTSSVVSSSSAPAAAKPPAPAADRPIKDIVIERPMHKAVPPNGGAGAAGKKPSRFRARKAAEAVAEEGQGEGGGAKEVMGTGKGKGKERAVELELVQAHEPVPTPVHTISLSGRPSASSSTAPAVPPEARDGVVSYADIPFSSDEDEPLDDSDDEDVDWTYSDSDDDEEFDVDAALHAREVALAYHQQRQRVGAGRGTGPLGGWHGVGEVWGVEGRAEGGEDGLVPNDADLRSLTTDPSLSSSQYGSYPHAGSAQEGRPSRFRLSNRHLEQAQLFIPSLVAGDPGLTTSRTPLGPALGPGGAPGAGGAGEGEGEGAEAEDEDQARLRRALALLAEGKPLPADEQAREAAREVQLREEWARERAAEKARSVNSWGGGGGKAPAMAGAVSFAPQDPTAAPAPTGAEWGREGEALSQEEELARLLMPLPGEGDKKVASSSASAGGEAAPAQQAEAERPVRMSRFRQKQLGLID
ncbi:hypothetical protein JCM10207_007139 [Rhodosporidiobolus poonsookiae]